MRVGLINYLYSRVKIINYPNGVEGCRVCHPRPRPRGFFGIQFQGFQFHRYAPAVILDSLSFKHVRPSHRRGASLPRASAVIVVIKPAAKVSVIKRVT
jgi:hypothetical protein